jgi:hypothetical protein
MSNPVLGMGWMNQVEVLVVALAGLACSRMLRRSRTSNRHIKFPNAVPLGIALGVSVVAVLLARVTGFADRLSAALGTRTALEVDADDLVEKLRADPRLGQRLQGKSRTEVRELGAALAREGRPRMDEQRLLLWARLNAKIADASKAFLRRALEGG